MNQTILETLQSFSLEEYAPIFTRDLDLSEPLTPKRGNLVKAITGMRRSGKTYRLFQEMASLVASGVPKERILYFNFEDDRLFPITGATGDQVIEAFAYMNPGSLEDGIYLFFDELQEMQDWGAWLRRVVDTTKATVYVTGSSSKMLSLDLSTEFRGRALEFAQYPLSFKEYLRFHHSALRLDQLAFSLSDRARIEHALDAYLVSGGFPNVQELPSDQAIPLLQSYVRRVVARDVVERHNLGNPQAVMAFARKVMALSGRSLSVRKAANELSSAGLKVGRETLAECTRYFEEAFLVLPVRERSRTLSEANRGLKAYPVDVGLARSNAPASAVDSGIALEACVAAELFRRCGPLRRDAVSYLKTNAHGLEVDFVVGDALFNEGVELYQVTESLDDPKVEKREMAALWEAMDELGVGKGTVIVGKGDLTERHKDGKVIECIPAWQWLLDLKP